MWKEPPPSSRDATPFSPLGEHFIESLKDNLLPFMPEELEPLCGIGHELGLELRGGAHGALIIEVSLSGRFEGFVEAKRAILSALDGSLVETASSSPGARVGGAWW